MAGDLELKVRISAQLGELRKGLDTLQKELDETGDKGAKAGRKASQELSGLERSVQRAGTALAGFATIYTYLAAVKGIANLTDDYARLNAQLKLNTATSDEFNVAQREVFRIAQETRAPVQDVANTYATLARSTKALGASQQEVLGVLETVNKAIALTPVSAETARATLTQFGQALTGDFKAGAQEINSILEQTPGLAEAIAKGLGTTSDRLKEMGEAGELSREKVFKALQAMASDVDAQFSQIPLTVGGALTQLQNDVLMTFGNTDVTPLTDALSDLRETLTDPATVEGLTNLASALVNLTALAAEAASEFADLGQQFGYLGAKVTGNVTPLEEIERRIKDVDRALNNSVLGKPVKYLFTSPEDLQKERAELERMREVYERAAGIKRPDPNAEKAKADERRKQLADEAKAALEAANAQAKLEAEQKKAAEAAERRQKQVDDYIANLQKQADTYGMSADQVARYELRLLGASNAEQDRAAALAKELDDLKAAEQAKEDAIKAEEKRKEREKEIREELADIRIRTLEAAGQTFEARKAELEQQYGPLIDELQAKGDEAGVALVNGLINTELAQARLDEMQAKISAATDNVRATEESVDNRVAIGEISGVEGQAELTAAREKAIADLQAVKAEIQALGVESPEAAQAIAQIDTEIAKLGSQNVTGAEAALRRMRTELADLEANFAGNALENLSDGLGTALGDIATGAKSAGDAFKDMARNFINSLAQMAAQALAKKAILAMFGGPGGLFAGVLHTGGIAGMSGGTVRNVPAFAFANAPRYHSGGIAGLKPGEVPAVLQQGEEVLTKSDPRHSLNGGGQAGGGNNGVRVVNVIDPNLVQDYLTSSAGERTILNVVERNAGAIKQKLG